MKNKLAGVALPLQDVVAQTIEAAREKMKLAAAEKEEKKGDDKEKVKKLVAYEKKEHGGHIPSAKEEEEEKEKCSSVIDPADPEEVEKLAAALDYASEKLADSVELGKEVHQGGEVLQTGRPVGGTQPYKKDKSKSHNIPMQTGSEKPSDAKGAPANAVATDEKSPAYLHQKQPADILRKKAGVDLLKEEVEKMAGGFGKDEKGKKDEKKEEKDNKEKKSSSEAAEYILAKISEAAHLGGEHKQGGETLSSTAPVPSNPGRQLISSNAAPKAATKREAKAPRKKELAEVLTEPAMSAAHDSKVQENLRSASKGGVKIAAAVAKAFLAKIAEEGCTCSDAGTCRHCKMTAAMKKKQSTVADKTTV